MGISICLASLSGSLASFKESHSHLHFPGILSPMVLGTPSCFLTTASLKSVMASYIIYDILYIMMIYKYIINSTLAILYCRG